MDWQLFTPVFNFPRKRKKLFFVLMAGGVSVYAGYNIFHLPSVAKKRKQFFKIIGSLISVAELVSDFSELTAVFSKDLIDFIQSDSDQIPNSLKQAFKISKSDAYSETVIRAFEALTLGILRGYHKWDAEQGCSPRPALSDRLLDKLFSSEESGFASVVIGSFARNLVLAFYSDNSTSEYLNSKIGSTSRASTWVDVVCGTKCRELIAECVQRFVSTAVAVYLDKTMEINTYDEIFSALTNPKHEKEMKDVLVSTCNSAVETLVKTSHRVLTASNLNSSSSSSSSSNSSHSSVVRIKTSNQQRGEPPGAPQNICQGDAQNSGLVNRVSSALAIPRNRRLVLDVTGRVTSETVRSFLNYLGWKFMDILRRSADFAQREAIERGLAVLQYIGAKYTIVITVCFALCLHLLTGARVLAHC